MDRTDILSLSAFTPSMVVPNNGEEAIVDKRKELYAQSPDESRVAAATKKMVKDINKAMQQTVNANSPSITFEQMMISAFSII